MFNKNKITLETRENKLEKIKKKGLRKTLFTTVMSMGVLLGCTGMLVGCGEAGPKGDTGAQGPQGEQGIQGIQGVPGVAGSMWFTGTALTGTGTEIEATIENTKIGDIYFNTTTCDLYQCIDENTWNWLANIKGDTGEQGGQGIQGVPGEQGQQGEQGATGAAGEDGISAYVGYDGYIWNGTERTEFSVNANLGANVVENTIGIQGIMSKYFTGSYLDLSTNTVALMANYMPNAGLTQYSGTTITELKVYAEETGNLYIGTAKVVDIVSARTNGTTYTSTTTAYEVQAGLNTITFTTPITVAEDETIVFGGQGSVGLYFAQGITTNDEHGNYTLIDGTSHTKVISETNDIQDTLAIQVSAKVQTSTQLVSGFADVETLTSSSSGLTETYNNLQPFVYSNLEMFENKQITKIHLFVTGTIYNNGGSTNSEIDDNTEYTYDIQVIDSSSVVAGGTYNVLRTYTLRVLGSEVIKNAWNVFDISDLGIFVSEGETLGFGSVNSTLENYYLSSNKSSELHYFGYTSATDTKLKERTTFNMLVGVEGLSENTNSDAFEKHIEELKEKEEEAYTKK